MLRKIVRAWARWSLDWRAHVVRHALGARGSLRGVAHLLTAEERATWPAAWKAHCGWVHPHEPMTWREIMSWLTQLDVEVPSAYHGSKMHGHGFGQLGLRDVSGATAGLANAPHATRLLAALRLGHVYPQLLAHVRTLRHEAESDGHVLEAPLPPSTVPPHIAHPSTVPPRTAPHAAHGHGAAAEGAHMAAATAARARSAAASRTTLAPHRSSAHPRSSVYQRPAPAWQLGDGRELHGERVWWQSDSWRLELNAFFSSSEDAIDALGPKCRTISLGEADGGRAIEHLSVLSALRVVIEMNEPARWAGFVEGLSAAHVTTPRRVRLPRFTAPHPKDDGSTCPHGAVRAYCCLGCPTPRILLEGMICGRCSQPAATPIDEYLALGVPTAGFYVVEQHGKARAWGAQRSARGRSARDVR